MHIWFDYIKLDPDKTCIHNYIQLWLFPSDWLQGGTKYCTTGINLVTNLTDPFTVVENKLIVYFQAESVRDEAGFQLNIMQSSEGKTTEINLLFY